MTEPLPLAPRRVLVTGAAGLLGRALLDLLADQDVPATALVLEDSEADVKADRVVVGNASDQAVAREAVEDADAVIHLAALRAPMLGTPAAVFCGNSAATFVVLEEAAQAGIRRAAFASSISILGTAFSPELLSPEYVPVDERTPLQVEDPYALSKQADEATGSMMWRRYGMTSVALRYSFLGRADDLARRAKRLVDDPASGARDFWTYLDVRDAARAAYLAVTVAPPGCHVAFVMAPEILAPYPTEDLLAAFHPTVEHRAPLPGRTSPVDVSVARELLGFSAEHLQPVEPRHLGG